MFNVVNVGNLKRFAECGCIRLEGLGPIPKPAAYRDVVLTSPHPPDPGRLVSGYCLTQEIRELRLCSALDTFSFQSFDGMHRVVGNRLGSEDTFGDRFTLMCFLAVPFQIRALWRHQTFSFDMPSRTLNILENTDFRLNV